MVNRDTHTGYVNLKYLGPNLYHEPSSAAVSRSVH
jgi:hypothetical protein